MYACFTETKLDDSANPVASNMPGALCLWSQGGWIWCVLRKRSFYFYLTCQLHICFRPGFIYNSPEQKRTKKVKRKRTNPANWYTCKKNKNPPRDFHVYKATGSGTAQNLLVRPLRACTDPTRGWEGNLYHKWPFNESICTKNTANLCVNRNTDKSTWYNIPAFQTENKWIASSRGGVCLSPPLTQRLVSR